MKKLIALSTFALCAVVLPASANPNKPVERPFKCVGTVTWIVDVFTGAATGQHAGLATHAGRFSSECWAVWDLANMTIVQGEGISTTVSGDELHFIMNLDPPMAIQFTGGTGRFEGASGVAPTIAFSVVASELDVSTGILTMTIDYVLGGTITY